MSNASLRFGLVLVALQAVPASAQEARYELGRRVRAFEREWDRQPDESARRAASPALSKAVQAFFRL